MNHNAEPPRQGPINRNEYKIIGQIIEIGDKKS